MTATVTDLFCGAGGSSLGAAAAGMELRLAANHWQAAIDVHRRSRPGWLRAAGLEALCHPLEQLADMPLAQCVALGKVAWPITTTEPKETP